MPLPEFIQNLLPKQEQQRQGVPDNVWDLVSTKPAQEERELTKMTLDQQIKTLLEQAPQQTALDLIREEEGFFGTPTPDSEGVLTVGSGFNLTQPDVARLVDAAVIQGRRPISEEENMRILKILVDRAENDAKAVIPTYDKLDPARQRILTSMAYQLGRNGLRGFEKMGKAIAVEDWNEAANQIWDSEAAKQTPNRFKRNREMFRAGGE